MATKKVKVHANLSGIASPTLELLTPGGSTTPVNGFNGVAFVGDLLTLSTQAKHSWEATVDESLDGLYRAVVVSGSTVIMDGWVYMIDDTTDRYVESDRSIALLVPILAALASSSGVPVPTELGGSYGLVDSLESISDRIAVLPSNSSIADAVWDETTSSHTTVGTFGASVNDLVSRITSTLFNGITSLGNWLGAIAGKTTDATTLTEIQATTAGASYSNLTDSLEALKDNMASEFTTIKGATFDSATDTLEAIRDRGDAAWTGSGSVSAAAIADAVWDEIASGHTVSGSFGEYLTNVNTRIPSALFNGITSMADWLGLIAGSATDLTTLAEIQATTAGASYDNTTDSLQSVRDRGDSAWVTATTASAAAIADAVWDELQSGHVASGSFGESIQNLTTRIPSTLFTGVTSMADWLGALAGKSADATTLAEINATTAGATYSNVTDSLEANKDNATTEFTAIKGATFSTSTDSLEAIRDRGDGSWITATPPTTAAIADAVWDEAASGHVTSGTFGAYVGNLNSRITSTLFSGITSLSKWLGALAGKTSDAATLTEIQATTAGATFDNTTDSLQAVRDQGDGSWTTGTPVSAATIADAVWDELQSGHTLAGSYGEAINNIEGRIPSTLFTGITSMADWLGAIAGKATDATTLTEINATTAGATYNNTTDSNEAIRDRGDGSWITATPPTTASIADAVWDEAASGHTTAGTFGEYAGNLNTRITSTLFTGITSMADWFGIIAGKTADATTLAEINATTAGATYNNLTDALEAVLDTSTTEFTAIKGATFNTATDSLEAIRNQGDISWLTSTSSSLAAIADAVWDEPQSGHTTTGTTGEYLGNLHTRIPAALFSGITSLARWLGLIAGKAADVTMLTEINATSGGATYDNSTDSLESIRERGDGAWVTGVKSITLPIYSATSEGEGTTSKLKQYYGETKTHKISVYELSGTTLIPVDMSLKKATLEFKVQDADGQTIFTISGAAMTISGASNNIVEVPVDQTELEEQHANYEFSLRDTGDGDFVWSSGEFLVRYVP